jgi:hypothetical protein
MTNSCVGSQWQCLKVCSGKYTDTCLQRLAEDATTPDVGQHNDPVPTIPLVAHCPSHSVLQKCHWVPRECEIEMHTTCWKPLLDGILS